MNLTIQDIFCAHKARIEAEYEQMLARLSAMPPKKPIADADVLFASLRRDHALKIMPDNSHVYGFSVATATKDIRNDLISIQSTYKALKKSKMSQDEPSREVMEMAWICERQHRGELQGEVTMGAGPLTTRVLAAIAMNRARENVGTGICATTINKRDVMTLADRSDDELTNLAASEVSTYASTSEGNHDFYKLSEFSIHDGRLGDVTFDHINIRHGQVGSLIYIPTIKTGHELLGTYINDASMILPTPLPASAINAQKKEKIEKLYDHPITRGLDLIIEGYSYFDDDTNIYLRPGHMNKLAVSDLCESIWAENEIKPIELDDLDMEEDY